MTMSRAPDATSHEALESSDANISTPDIAQRRLMELVRRLGGDPQHDDLDGSAAEEVITPVDIDSIARLRLVDRIAALDDNSESEPELAPPTEPVTHIPEVTDAAATLDLSALRSALGDLLPASTPRIEATDVGAAPDRLPVLVQPLEPLDEAGALLGEATVAPTAEARLADLIRHQRTLLDRLTTIEPMEAETAPEAPAPLALPGSADPAKAENEGSVAASEAESAVSSRLIDLLKPVPEPLKSEPVTPSLIEALAVPRAKEPAAPPLPPIMRLPLAMPQAESPASSRTLPPPSAQPQPAPAAERAPIIIEKARAERSAQIGGAPPGIVTHPSGIPGLVIGLAVSCVIAAVVYGTV